MGVYVRERKLKSGKVKKYYYVRNVVEGRMRYKAVGPVGVVTKTVAQVVDGEIKKKKMLGRHDEIVAQSLHVRPERQRVLRRRAEGPAPFAVTTLVVGSSLSR